MSRNELIALALVVLAEIVRGGRECFNAVKEFIIEYLKNPAKFWPHVQRATVCLMLCTFSLAPAYFYLTEFLKQQA